MDDLLSDFRYALRQIRRRPIFTVVAALSLAIGVGANTAMFSAVNVLLMRPPSGVNDIDRVVEVGRTTQGHGFDTFSYPDYLDWSQSPAFEATSAFTYTIFSFATDDGGQRVNGMHVEPAYFRVLGLQPALGRFFADDEDTPGTVSDVAVLGYGFWQDRLGGDPDIIGRTLEINRVRLTVVGVAPEGFAGHDAIFDPAIYLTFRSSSILQRDESTFESRGSSWHMALGRLAPGRSVEEADAQVEAVYASLAETYPETNRNRSGQVVTLGSVPGGARPFVGAFLGILMAMVGLILLVTCTNVAGMFLARATAREREIAVRLALGAGRRRLVRQLLVEALAVFAIGGAIGGALGAWLLGLVPVDALPLPVSVDIDLSPDPVVLAFATAATVLTGIVFGLVPALGATRLELVSSLKDDGAGRRVGRSRLRRFFVAAQVGISLVLLVGAGLFTRSLQRAAQVEVGFDPSGSFMTSVDLELEGYDDDGEQGLLVQDRIRARVAAIPGVEQAALSIDLPLDLGSHGTAAYPEGWEEEDRIGVDFNIVSPNYFATLRIPMMTGRDFSEDDRAGSEPVVIVSQDFVDAVWPGQDAVGRRVKIGVDSDMRTVIGVVADVKNQLVTDPPKPFAYVPLRQGYRGLTNVVVRATPAAGAVAPALRSAILDVDPSLSLTPVVSLERYTGLGILPQRIAAGISTTLGVLALLLSGMGVYGVVALAVTQRTREIGIRMALGAGRGAVVGLIVRSGLGLCLPGIAVGAVLAVGLGQAMRSFLLGLSPLDPVTLGAVAVALLAVVSLASVVPARRASTVQPVEALRVE